mgnify:CR=1 FL=1
MSGVNRARQDHLAMLLVETTLSPEKLDQIEAMFGIQRVTHEGVTTIIDTIEVDPKLTKFAEMYNRWSSESKSRLSWKRVQVALLAYGEALLNQAEAMPNGPIMFGADKEGNILFANGGVEPILTGKRYSIARKAAHAIKLELFPYVNPHEKSEEILLFEEFTGEPIVRSEDKLSRRSTYLEDGDCDDDDNFGSSCVAHFDPSYEDSILEDDVVTNRDYQRGIRGLLRAKA